MGSFDLMGTEFQFGKTTKFCRRMVEMAAHSVSVLNATAAHLENGSNGKFYVMGVFYHNTKTTEEEN